MSYDLLEQRAAAVAVPAPVQAQGKARLYEDGVFPTADGKARFANVAWQPVAEPRDARYPFSLTTGRLRDQWHGMSRTGTLGRLFGHVAEPSVQMHPQDMARRLLEDGDLVHVTSRRGSIVVPVQASDEVGLSQAFMAMHWGPEFLSGRSSTGDAAGRRERAHHLGLLPHFEATRTQARGREDPEGRAALVAAGRRLAARRTRPCRRASSSSAVMALFPFASCVPFGRERAGVLLRAAAHEAPAEELLARIETLLGLAGADVLRYADRKQGPAPRHAAGRATAPKRGSKASCWPATPAPSPGSRPCCRTNCRRRPTAACCWCPAPATRGACSSRGRQICTCLNVTDAAIERAPGRGCGGSAEAARLASLQAELKCGTELRLLRAGTQAPGAAPARRAPWLPDRADGIGRRHSPYSAKVMSASRTIRRWASASTSRKSAAASRARVRSAASRRPTCSGRCSMAR